MCCPIMKIFYRSAILKTFLCFLLLFPLATIVRISYGQVTANSSQKEICKTVDFAWLKEILGVTKNCVGFSAPVSARALSYMSIGMYEAQVEMMKGYRSLSDQLQGFTRQTWQSPGSQLYWPHVANTVMLRLTLFFYKNMAPAQQTAVHHNYEKLLKQYTNRSTRSLLAASASYGNNLANEIIEWSKNDHAHEAYNSNFPKSYSPAACQGCWTQTVPGYLPALQPYWGNNRLFLPSSASIGAHATPIPFSADSASAFYQSAKEISDLYNHLDKQQETIAKYWDDSPGYSGTPAGHIFSLAMQLSNQHQLSLEKMLQLYVLLGIAINDSNIACWKLKYTFNLLRPVSYIQRYISPSFNSLLTTPPFPEFPSGHSYQSGAAAAIFISFFGDSSSFTDSTNINRADINGTPRLFKNFSAMAQEISDSRFYGGIHFKNTLDVSLALGKKTGENALQLQFLQ